MELEKAHADYYTLRCEYYKLHSRKGKTLLFVNDDWTEVIVTNMRFKVLHVIVWQGDSMGIEV